jgi:hypothetical protein
MHYIATPIKADDKEGVTNLQAALVFLLNKSVYKTYVVPNTPTEKELNELKAKLQQEQQSGFYGDATKQLVFIFQIQESLGELKGEVEEKTADKLNEVLKGLGAFDEVATSFFVQGTKSSNDGKPYNGATIKAFDKVKK